MNKMRLRFSKTGSAKYISHLDLMRTMRRAFLRAGIGLRYSEGYNPHPYVSAALPLSVGTESVCELMDFEPLEYLPSDVIERMNNALPDGLSILEIYESGRKFNEIAWVEVRGRCRYENNEGLLGLAEGLIELFSSGDSIVIRKKTKRGESELDTEPHIKSAGIYVSDDKEVIVTARLSAAEPVINTIDLLNALRLSAQWREPDYSTFRRIELYDGKHNVYK